MQRIISQTPTRISLFGGGTDYPAYYSRKPGATFGLTIDQYIYVSLHTVSPFFDYKMRISYSKIELVKTIDEIQHPSVKACLNFKNISSPLDIHISGDLPAKTGLGSSSSFTVGFLNALYALQGIKATKKRLAEEACYVEQSEIGENVGSQDQYHAAYGGMNIFEFSSSKIKVRPIVISPEKKRLFEAHLLVFYTGLTRYATEVVKEQIEKTRSLSNDCYLDRMYEMVFEAEEIVSQSSDQEVMSLLGNLLHESWNLKKQLSSQISNPFIDRCYGAALSAGAYGGKLCGAGNGGFLAFLVPPEARSRVREELKDLLEVRFRLEDEGSTIIFMRE
ncbi:MAG: kinase [Verrucomicrobia bacterium]|nr:kinase [Verrucomicrobiota bacterium]